MKFRKILKERRKLFWFSYLKINCNFKGIKYFYLLIIPFVFGNLFSCQNYSINKKPEILTAEYEIKNFNGTEQGFDVFLVIGKIPEGVKIKSIVLKNRRFDKINSNTMTPNEIFIDQYLAVNSQMIKEFISPPTDNRRDGILFEDGNQEFFIEVELN